MSDAVPASCCLSSDEVHVWYALPEEMASDEAQAAQRRLLSGEELAAQARFVQEKDQLLYLSAHALLRRVLSHYTGEVPQDWQFQVGSHGKPALVNSVFQDRLKFNLSHTRGLVACVVCLDHSVGIDVERMRRKLEVMSLAERFFSPAEVETLRRTPHSAQKRLFYRFWTLKEAFIKAIGAGLAVPLESFSFQFADDSSDLAELATPVEIGLNVGELVARPSGPAMPEVLTTASIHYSRLTVQASKAARPENQEYFPELRKVPLDWQFAQVAPTADHLLAVALAPGRERRLTIHLHQATERFLTCGT